MSYSKHAENISQEDKFLELCIQIGEGKFSGFLMFANNLAVCIFQIFNQNF